MLAASNAVHGGLTLNASVDSGGRDPGWNFPLASGTFPEKCPNRR